MQLFLIRHAAAEPDAEGGDAARALTPQGRKSFTKVVRGLKRLGITFDRLVHSPLLRAVQTAELCTPLVDGESEVSPLLAAAPGEALVELCGARGERVALVGHEPYLSQLCAWLVTGWQVHDAPGRPAAFELRKGGVAWLDGDPAPGALVLRALYPPQVLKRTRGR
jgi:phosphohistidine phosphatase